MKCNVNASGWFTGGWFGLTWIQRRGNEQFVSSCLTFLSLELELSGFGARKGFLGAAWVLEVRRIDSPEAFDGPNEGFGFASTFKCVSLEASLNAQSLQFCYS